MDDILNDHPVSLGVSKDDASLLTLFNKVGVPCIVFSTFVTYLGSFAFRVVALGMVWDSHFQTHQEPIEDEQECAMDF